MGDLVKRLRSHAWGGYCHKPTLEKAADLIEAQAALMAEAQTVAGFVRLMVMEIGDGLEEVDYGTKRIVARLDAFLDKLNNA